MSPAPLVTKQEGKYIKDLVAHFVANRGRFEHLVGNLVSALQQSEELRKLTHSLRWRVKDPDHLEDKLLRNLRERKAKGSALGISRTNLFAKINDLAGVRLLHLHTSQFVGINQQLLSVFDEEQYRLIEGPAARAWDDESRQFFEQVGVETKSSPTMYTSVHYILRANSKTTLTCELQVRTLAEELWGEVDHALNYPHPHSNESCRDLIRVLARMTSGSSRLVDSIFRVHRDTRSAAAPAARRTH